MMNIAFKFYYIGIIPLQNYTPSEIILPAGYTTLE